MKKLIKIALRSSKLERRKLLAFSIVPTELIKNKNSEAYKRIVITHKSCKAYALNKYGYCYDNRNNTLLFFVQKCFMFRLYSVNI